MDTKYNFAIVCEDKVELFETFESMECYVRKVVSENLYWEDFDTNFFLNHGYSEVDNGIFWTDKVTLR